MSVTCSVALVPWNEFSQAVTEGAQTEDDAVALAMRFEPESLADNSQQRQDDLLAAFDGFAKACPPASVANFAAVFDALFWTWRSKEHRIWDLPVPPDKLPFGPESAWSPATVKRQAAAWRGISLDEFRKHFRPTEVFAAFDEFKQYAQEWGDIIQRGADRNLGLVTFTWG